MKLKHIVVALIFSLKIAAQDAPHLEIPKTNYSDFGFINPVKHVEIAYYEADSLNTNLKMQEFYSFNKEGNITQKFTRILGKYGSETAKNYSYTNGILDSINTYASAKNFNSIYKLFYNDNMKLIKGVATGVYTNYTDTYNYDESGLISSVVRMHENGSKQKSRFIKKYNFVEDRHTSKDGKEETTAYIYDENELYASFIVGSQKITFYNIPPLGKDIEQSTTEDLFTFIVDFRALKNKNYPLYKTQMRNFSDKSTVLFNILEEENNAKDEWIKRLHLDNSFGQNKKSFVFRKLIYADGTESGSADFDNNFKKMR
jgi:hypothetical protein